MPRREATLRDIIAGSKSVSFRAINAHLYTGAAPDLRGLPGAVAEPNRHHVARSADRGEAKSQTGMDGRGRTRDRDGARAAARTGPGVRVHLISFRRAGTPLDRDNLIGGAKQIRDQIARWLGLDDNERFIAWEYSQCETRGRKGLAVQIEILR